MVCTVTLPLSLPPSLRARACSYCTPKHPFSWPELESGQSELQSGQFGPQLGKMFEKWAKRF